MYDEHQLTYSRNQVNSKHEKYEEKPTKARHVKLLKRRDPEITRPNRKQDSTTSAFISDLYLLQSIRIERLKIKMLN